MSLPISAGRRRRTESGLIAMALVLIGAAYVLASLGRAKTLPTDIIGFLAGVLALFVGAHLVIRKFAPNADPIILPTAALLNGLGYVLIARLNAKLAAQQAGWTLVGLVGFTVVLVVIRRLRLLERNRYTIGLVGLGLVLLPLVPKLGVSIHGARIWARLGPVSFQPGEFAKIALAIFFAAYLVERREVLALGSTRIGPIALPDLRALGPVLAVWGVSMAVIVFETDLGSALLFFVLFLSVLWIATERAGYLAVGSVLFGVGAVGSWRAFGHVQTRVSMWLDPWKDPLGKGYQIVQAQYALAWGGPTGRGHGLGLTGRIPFQETHFIFAIIGEELGLARTTLVLIAFLLLAGCGFRTAVRLTDPFSKLLAVGLTTLLATQSFLIMAGVTRLLPLTGLTLPFVSYGGSSLVANWVLVGLLVRLSDQANTPVEAPDDLTTVLAVHH